MQIAPKYADKIFTFAFSHYQSPNNNIAGFYNVLYNYFQTGVQDTIFPSLPSKVYFEYENATNTITQNKEKIFKVSWDNDYHDDYGIMRVNLYKNEEQVAYRVSTRSETGISAHEPDFLYYKGYIESSECYKLGFIDTWGNETISPPFSINKEKGYAELLEKTSMESISAQIKSEDVQIYVCKGNACKFFYNAKEAGEYELRIYSISGYTICSECIWIKEGNNLICPNIKVISPLIIKITKK